MWRICPSMETDEQISIDMEVTEVQVEVEVWVACPSALVQIRPLVDVCDASKVIQPLFPFLNTLLGTLVSCLKQSRIVHTSSASLADTGLAAVSFRLSKMAVSTQSPFFLASLKRPARIDLSVVVGKTERALMSSFLGWFADMPFRVSSSMSTFMRVRGST